MRYWTSLRVVAAASLLFETLLVVTLVVLTGERGPTARVATAGDTLGTTFLFLFLISAALVAVAILTEDR